MSSDRRWLLIAAYAPLVWGSTYFVTRHFLPDAPLWGATLRALPAGLLLLLLVRRLPSGSWWWKALVLGVLNVGAFFVLIYQAAHLLPTSIATTIMATSPIALGLVAWLLVHERPDVRRLTGAVVGLGGVCLLLLGASRSIDGVGVLASVSALVTSSFGFVLGKRWNSEVGVLASTSWQLTIGGLLLLPLALVVEGAIPAVGIAGVLAYGYVTVIATGVAFLAWFGALQHLRADTVGLMGLLNPVAGVMMGVLLGGEVLAPHQMLGLVLVLGGVGGPLLLRRRRAAKPSSPMHDCARFARAIMAPRGRGLRRPE